MRRLVPVLAFALLALPVPALACTPPPGYSVPTNLQLASEANTIVLGEVVRGGVGTADEPLASTIVVRPIRALKGLMPGGELIIAGMAIAPSGETQANAASDPLAFGDAHPEAYAGGCIRRTFPAGARVLFFLEREDGRWVPAGGAFSRWAEDVADEQAPWVQLATLYAHASLLPADQRTALLEDELEALQVHPDEPAAIAMAADIERSLAGPAPPLVPPPPPASAPPPVAEPPPAAEAGEPADDAAEEDRPDDLADVEAAIDAFGEDE